MQSKTVIPTCQCLHLILVTNASLVLAFGSVSALGPPLLKKPRFQLSFEGGFADNEITGVWFLYSDDSDEALYAGAKY